MTVPPGFFNTLFGINSITSTKMHALSHLRWLFFFFNIGISLIIADGPQRARLPMPPTAPLPSCLWSQRIFLFLPRLSSYEISSRCKFSSLTTRQLVVEFLLNSRCHAFRYYYGRKNTLVWIYRKCRPRTFRCACNFRRLINCLYCSINRVC